MPPRDDAVPSARTYKSRLYHLYNDSEVKDDLNRKAEPEEPLSDLVINGYHLLGYDWRDKKRAYAPRQISAKVLRIKAGHLILDPDPTSEPGSSGSCVLNDRNEVVAINCFVMKLASTESVAVVVGVWGEWRPDLTDPPVLNFQ